MKTYTTEQIAAILQLDGETIRRYIKQGKLKAMKFGRVWRVTEEELQRFMDES